MSEPKPTREFFIAWDGEHPEAFCTLIEAEEYSKVIPVKEIYHVRSVDE